MEEREIKRILEALLFVFSEPIPMKRLLAVLPEVTAEQVRQCMEQLNEEYKATSRAFLIKEIAGGYQIMTDPTLAEWIQKATAQPKANVVSKAALETLAIIAYRQPLTKAEIEVIRGVDAGAALETLMERQFVKIAGRKDTPGKPYIYGTTPEFLKHFGLKSLEQLPKLEELTLKELEAQEQKRMEEANTPGPALRNPASLEEAPQPFAESAQAASQESKEDLVDTESDASKEQVSSESIQNDEAQRPKVAA